MRLLKILSVLIVVFYILPLSVQASLLLLDRVMTSAQASANASADMASAGLLPAADAEPTARVLIMSVPLSGAPGRFLSHSWIVYKQRGGAAWMRYDVLGFASRDASGALNSTWLDSQPALNRYAADGRWFGKVPEIIVSVEGTAAEAMIPKIERGIADYSATAGHYRTWPGPNSNTFVAAIMRAVPELGATLPPTAVGKDFRRGVFVGQTDSHTGIELNLGGLLGVKVGQVEGVEVNLLSLVAGVDLRQLSVKLPGVGLVGFGTRQGGPLPGSARAYAEGRS